MRLSACIAAFTLLVPALSFAQTPPEAPPMGELPPGAPPPLGAPPAMPPPEPMTPPPAPPAPMVPAAAAVTMAEPSWYQLLTVEALVDSYYQINMRHADDDTLTGPVAVRNFDLTSNSFSLNYAKLGLGMSVKPVAFRIDLGYGHTGALINFASASASGGGTTGPAMALYGNAFIVQQAYASLTLPGDMLTIDFGKFNTTAGAEVIEANKNWLYSRSLLFFVIPLLHTGVRANVKVSDALTLQASVVNGINNDPDNNGEKTYGLSAAITAGIASIYATGYFGKEGAQGAEGDWRITGDLVAALTLSDQFGLNVNFDYIKLGDANLEGISVMGRFQAAEHAVLGFRGEYLSDKGIFFAPTLANRTGIYEGTVMLGAPFAKHFEARLEFRGDFFEEDMLFGGDNNQFTGTLAFLGYM